MPATRSTNDDSGDTQRSPLASKGRRRIPKRHWMILVGSAVVSMMLVIWVVQLAMSNLDAPTPIQVNNTSHRPSYAGGSSPSEIAALHREAKKLDRELLREREMRLAEDANRPRQNGDDVYEHYRAKVEHLETLIRGQELVPGTVAFDVNERLKELRADAPLSYDERRALREN